MTSDGENGDGESDFNPLGDYVGDRNDDGERHGNGEAILPNGDMYVGEYSRGSRHGKGLYVFKNGARYDGEWNHGLKHGRGIFWYPDGTRYEGEWNNDTKNGFGIYEYLNNDIYEGAWINDIRHGLGTYNYYKSGVKFIGTWIDDCMHGPGQLIYPQYRFYGCWEFNMPLGRGCFVFENGCMQHGSFIQNSNNISTDNVNEDGIDIEKRKNELVKEFKSTNDKSFPVWQAQFVTSYNPDLLPHDTTPLPPTKKDVNNHIELQLPHDNDFTFGDE